MTLKDFYAAVAAAADTEKQNINAAIVSRVLSVAFGVLATQNAATATTVVAKGIETAAKKSKKSM